MADLLIRGMEMPKYGCAYCFLRTGNYCGELSTDESVVPYSRKFERHPDCPLVELPDHGRLIDAAALIADLQYDSELAGRALACDDFANSRERDRVQFEKDCKDNCVRFVEQSDTIIPASKEGGK